MENYEFDLKGVFESMIEKERMYFDMLQRVSEVGSYADVCSKNILQMDMNDQMQLLKRVIDIGDISKKLCDKYGFIADNDDEDSTDDIE